MELKIYNSSGEANAEAADFLAELLALSSTRNVMVASGNTPLELYRLIGAKNLSLSHLEIFALDEYVGVPLEESRNCANLIRSTVIKPWRITECHFHWVSSLESDAAESVKLHERKIEERGGLDLVILGLGQNGHLAFNEPGSTPDSSGRVLDLQPVSIEANRAWFQGKYAPAKGATTGLKTILKARRAVILAYGSHKARAVQAMTEGSLSSDCPASFLQNHPAAHAFLDKAAAAGLSSKK